MTAATEDDDSWIDRLIEGFCQPPRPVDETPEGRLAGMDLDVGLALAEMRELITGRVPAISGEELDLVLFELLEQLGDVHERRMAAYEELWEARR